MLPHFNSCIKGKTATPHLQCFFKVLKASYIQTTTQEKMKFTLLISLQIMVVFGEQQVRLISECLTGVAAELPNDPKPITCLKPNEVYVCAYGEARCDGLLYCGTPPCHWG